MQVARKFHSDLFLHKKAVWAIGGDSEGTIERFDLIR